MTNGFACMIVDQAVCTMANGGFFSTALRVETVRNALIKHMGMVHKMVTEVCDEYFEKMRRAVFQTPKSYLSFIQSYKTMYTAKLNELVALGEGAVKRQGSSVSSMLMTVPY